jgi:arginine:ornithine antiporter/lysine permease
MLITLWVSSIVMQLTLFIILFAHNAGIWLIDITGVMVLPPYFASTLFLAIYSSNPEYVETHSESRHFALGTGVLASVYAIWMLYAAGPKFVLLSTIIFAVGIPVFRFAQRENGKPMFTRYEGIATVALVVVARVSLALFFKGIITIT